MRSIREVLRLLSFRQNLSQSEPQAGHIISLWSVPPELGKNNQGYYIQNQITFFRTNLCEIYTKFRKNSISIFQLKMRGRGVSKSFTKIFLKTSPIFAQKNKPIYGRFIFSSTFAGISFLLKNYLKVIIGNQNIFAEIRINTGILAFE